jgi:hypothetical protein
MTALLLIAGVIIFAMVVAGVWLMQYAEAESAARAVGRAPDPDEETEARQTCPRHNRASSATAKRTRTTCQTERGTWRGACSTPTAARAARHLRTRQALVGRTARQQTVIEHATHGVPPRIGPTRLPRE